MTPNSPFSCDLVENSANHRDFLRKVHSIGEKSLSTIQSLYRYRDLWLPLVAENTDAQLIPPPDVAWLWHCHRLAPFRYVYYSQQVFGSVLEANPPFSFQEPDDPWGAGKSEDAASRTRELWNNKYPQDPFFHTSDEETNYPTTNNNTNEESNGSEQLLGYDLLSASTRQSTFLWQISGIRFDDPTFLEEGRENYLKFLKLRPKAQEDDVILVPTIQIDLLWHTHILSSVGLYNSDCEAIMGSRLHHDDSMEDRSEGGLLNTSFRSTVDLWRSAYGSDYVVPGGMYRGDPPEEYFSPDWDAKKDKLVVEGVVVLPTTLGASSASPVTEWATAGSQTSTGEEAFIGFSDQHVVYERIMLQPRFNYHMEVVPRRPNYVLGKSDNQKVGYHHLETREAHEILKRRVMSRVVEMEGDVAFEESCCIPMTSPTATANLQRRLSTYRFVARIVRERQRAPRPHSPIESTKDQSEFCSKDGQWLYPDILWEAAGGACGGTVAKPLFRPQQRYSRHGAASRGHGGYVGAGAGCGAYYGAYPTSSGHHQHQHSSGGNDNGDGGCFGGGGGCGGGGCGGGCGG